MGAPLRITAAVVEAPGAPFCLEPVELEAPRRDEVLVRLAASGICHTDLKARTRQTLDGDPFVPTVFGHEGAGVVEAVGDRVESVRPGDRVALSYLSCGRCPRCAAAAPYYCDDLGRLNFSGRRPDGTTPLRRGDQEVAGRFFGQSSFATFCLASPRNLAPVPADVPLEVAAPFGCGVQTGAGAVLRALRAPAGSTLAVFGTGAVGLSAVLAAAVAGCRTVIGYDRVESRLELAAAMGATHTLHPGEGDPVEAVRQLTGGDGVDFALDTTGSAAVFEQALACLAPQGTLGFVAGVEEARVDWGELMRGRSVRGIIEGESRPRELFPVLFELWRQGRFPIERMMRTYDLVDIEQAAADALAGRTVKPVLRMPT